MKRAVHAVKVLIGLALAWGATAASASLVDFIPACTSAQSCGVVLGIDSTFQSVTFALDSKTGNFTLGSPATLTVGGASLTLNSASGNVDPFLLFSASATNNDTIAHTYSAAFSVPISLTGPVASNSTIGYSLTAAAGTTATIFPTSGVGKIADSQDIRTAPFSSVDKGVDIGDPFSVTAGALPSTQNYSDVKNSFFTLTSPAYTVMSVLVGFGLTPSSAVGLSGSVTQTPVVPVPSTFPMLIGGLGMMFWIARRRLS